MLFKDVIEEFLYENQSKGYTEKTLINKRQEFKQLTRYLEGKRGISELESITTHDLKAYIRYKQQQGLQPQSIQSMAKIITAFFNWCMREEYIEVNPMNKVPLPKVPKKLLKGFTNEEVGKIINCFSYKNYIEARNKAIVSMLADCGLRSMEIRGLTMSSIKDSTILVHGKGNKERNVFISPPLKKILIKYERLRKDYIKDKVVHSDHYFLTYKGGQMSHVALYNVIKVAGKRVGIEDVRCSPHTFRHFYSVNCLNSGNIDIYSLSRLLGHSCVSTTQRYLNSMTDAQLHDKAILSSPLSNLGKR